jgi:hypothetical protein
MKRKLLASSLSAMALATLLTAVPVQAASHDPNQGYNRVVNDVATVEAQHGAQLYSDPNKEVKTDRVLPSGSRWKVSLILDNGLLWYKVGRNQWISAADSELDSSKTSQATDNKQTTKPTTGKDEPITGVVVVTYKTPIVVWAEPGAHPTKRYLPRNSAWRYFKVRQTSDGNNWYNLGGNQWVPQDYVNNGQDPHIGHYAKQEPANPATDGMVLRRQVVTINNTQGKGAYVLDRNGKSTGRLLPNGSRWKSYGYINNGILQYNLGGDQWVDAYQTK